MDKAAWILPEGASGPMIPDIDRDPDALLRLANARMPFGRYKGELLLDLPQEYVFWFANRARPGTTGATRVRVDGQLAAIYSMRFNGQEQVLRALVESDEDLSEDSDQVGRGSGRIDSDEHDWIVSLFDDMEQD